MPKEYGPQQFELTIRDTFTTNNPKNSSSDITVSAVVPIIINWDLARTKLDEKNPVIVSGARWLDAGKGPHPVYVSQVGGKSKAVGTISWELVTEVLRKVEKHASKNEYRNLVTPYLRLLRTFTPTDGGSPTTVEASSHPSTATGNWFKPD